MVEGQIVNLKDVGSSPIAPGGYDGIGIRISFRN